MSVLKSRLCNDLDQMRIGVRSSGGVLAVKLDTPSANWPTAYSYIDEALNMCLTRAGLVRDTDFKIKHIGSTALNIKSKPVIDIALGLTTEYCDKLALRGINENLGLYDLEIFPQRAHDTLECFSKCFAMIHVGFGGQDSPFFPDRIVDQIVFAQYLRDNRAALDEYERLKIASATTSKEVFEYTEKKRAFVSAKTADARATYSPAEISDFCQ